MKRRQFIGAAVAGGLVATGVLPANAKRIPVVTSDHTISFKKSYVNLARNSETERWTLTVGVDDCPPDVTVTDLSWDEASKLANRWGYQFGCGKPIV